ncbi:CoA-binding protein [Aneurinibacillus sp. Ricciae_BoGa-3]|uniref:CoA-binding protein n=1 Tax=Aneurinibacillus sp. Ricciae_BoGa-3 TaxID=3022697 RepID=UPI002341EA11|nr:CoA-binding protein [Aneurinibacillus sp. Ricciae_BoGa-3]WCK55542.1 CoA-binding protein [Aneurinibacillus sp. Ricciae_BoGa-3]
MMFNNPSDDKIRNILESAKTIAVVGLSDNPQRTSYMVAQAMQRAGYKIIPVNPVIQESLGEKAVASLTDIKEPVDVVNVFRRSETVMPVAEEAVKIGAKTFWLQLGIYNEDAAKHAEQNGLNVIMDRCIKVDHALLIRR